MGELSINNPLLKQIYLRKKESNARENLEYMNKQRKRKLKTGT